MQHVEREHLKKVITDDNTVYKTVTDDNTLYKTVTDDNTKTELSLLPAQGQGCHYRHYTLFTRMSLVRNAVQLSLPAARCCCYRRAAALCCWPGFLGNWALPGGGGEGDFFPF